MGWQDAPAVEQKAGWQSAPAVGAEAPVVAPSKPQGPNPFLSSVLNIGQGFLRMGPLGAAGAGAGEAMRGLDTASDTAGGAVVDDLSSKTVFGQKVPPEVAAAAGTVLKVGIPAAVGGIGGGTTGAPVMEAGAKKLMQQALRPGSKPLANSDAAKAIQTMLDEGVNATTGGAVKLRHMITKLRGDVAKAVSGAEGATVDKAYVYKELQQTLDDVSKLGRPDAPMAAVKQAWENFKNHPLAKGEKIPVQLADEMKRTTQRAVKDAYGRLTSTPVDDKIDMAIATGLRKGVEEAVPAVGPINAQLSKYLNALNLIEPRAAQEANKQIGGLVPLAPTPEAAMLMLADRNPWMKSYIARVLYSGKNVIPATAGGATAILHDNQ